MVAFLVLLFLYGPTLIAALLYNLGSIQMSHGLVPGKVNVPTLQLAQELFGLASRIGSGGQVELAYGLELARLGTLSPLDNSYRPDFQRWSNNERNQLLQRAAIQLAQRRADEARHNGQTVEEKAWRILTVELQPGNNDKRKQLAVWLVAEQGDIASAIAQYETALKIQEPTWQDYLRLIALNLKIGNAEQASYWHGQLQQRFPDKGYAYLHDLQNSYAELALAEAYAYFQLLSDAISVGERSLAMNNWDWGHRVVARFYQLQGCYPEAERHLQAAIQRPTNEVVLAQYRVALGDLYAEQGNIQQAVAEYCQVLHIARPVDNTGAQDVWHVSAVSRLAKLTEVAESEVSNWCASR